MSDGDTHSWIVRPRPSPAAEIALISVPFCGGAASVFHRLGRRLPEWIEVHSVQLPGRATRIRETPYRSMGPLVADLAAVLAPGLRAPYALFGYSLGALIAFELARELRRRRVPLPARLIAAACGAPDTTDPGRPIHALPDSEFISELATLNGTPGEILAAPDLMQALMPMLRADFCVHETYHYTPEAPLDCPISVLAGAEDPQVSRERLDAWRRNTRGGFSLHVLPGGHFFLNDALDAVAGAIAQDLGPDRPSGLRPHP